MPFLLLFNPTGNGASRFKMVARDVNSSPTQYRVWTTQNNPDYTGSQYTGPKSGTTPLVDVSVYDIVDPYLMDFNLPQPTSWHITYRTLPADISNSQLAIIDGYVYLFGGEVTSSIYRAPLNNPADWVDTGATLPSVLSGASYCDVGDGYIYLIGGRGSETQDTIYRASKSNPLVWTNMGHFLPQPIHKSQLAIADGYIYLFGGQGINTATNVIYRAPVSNPLSWIDTGATLPDKLYGSTLAVIGAHFVLLGGLLQDDSFTKNIYAAPVTSPLTWTVQGFLPYTSGYGQYVTIGDKGYFYGPGSVTDGNDFTRIYRCNTSNPFEWVDTGRVLPGQMMQSQLAVINDRIFLFGGNGNSIILACDQKLKYLPKSGAAVSYGNVSRTTFHATSFNDLQKTIGFPSWKSNYDGYGTVTQTPTLWALSSGTTFGNSTLYRLNSTTLAIQNSYPFPAGTGQGLDMVGLNGYLWVLTRAASFSTLWQMNPSEGSVVARIDFSEVNTFRLNSDGQRYLYVSGTNNNPAAYVIDSITHTVVNTYVNNTGVGGTQYGVVIDQDTRKLFQATGNNVIFRTNADINNFENITIGGNSIFGAFTMLAAGGFIWVSANGDTSSIIVKVDPVNEIVVDTIGASFTSGFSFNITDMKYNSKYNKIFVGYVQNGKIDVIDVATDHCTLLATTNPGYNVVGLATFGDFLWTCEDNTGHVSYINLQTNTVQTTSQVDFTGIAMVAYTI